MKYPYLTRHYLKIKKTLHLFETGKWLKHKKLRHLSEKSFKNIKGIATELEKILKETSGISKFK